MSLHPKPPAPKSLLGRHRLLGPNASVRVSPLSFGAMSLGSNWSKIFGDDLDKEKGFELLDTFYDLGGNFIDTANMYQGGQSEQWIGEWMKKTPGRRDEMVISTKYSLAPMPERTEGIQSNMVGTGSKTMHIAFNDSLRRLQTDYVDIFYVHAWDFASGVEEVMQSLNTLVQQRKVLYLGISDTPAWVIVKANCYARQHGLRPFSIYQGRYGAHVRDLERDVIPMAEAEGMAIHPWGVLGSGFFRAPDAGPKEGGRQMHQVKTGREDNVSKALDVVAKRYSVPVTSVAIAYVMHKAPNVFPIIGGSKPEYIKANVEALSLRLTREDLADIEKGYEFDVGFPHNLIGGKGIVVRGPENASGLNSRAYFDYAPHGLPVRPHQGALDEPWQP